MKINWIHHFLDLVYPKTCEGCKGALSVEENLICTECLINLPITNSHKEEINSIEKKFWGKLPVKHTLAYLKYSRKGSVQNMIHQLKYHNKPEIGIRLGELYGSILKREGYEKEFDFIVGVPLHPDKQKQRGYNQADCFAEGLSKGLGVEASTSIIKRKEFTDSQTKKSRIDRFRNVEGIFEVVDGELLKGKRIVIVDDVLTTGSTLESCGITLLEGGCSEVSIITIASAY